jgi:hypothetical protein
MKEMLVWFSPASPSRGFASALTRTAVEGMVAGRLHGQDEELTGPRLFAR